MSSSFQGFSSNLFLQFLIEIVSKQEASAHTLCYTAAAIPKSDKIILLIPLLCVYMCVYKDNSAHVATTICVVYALCVLLHMEIAENNGEHF